MTTVFDIMTSPLVHQRTCYESQHPTCVLRLTSAECILRESTHHVYRLPSSTDHTYWTHYKAILHSASGHLQRIPFLSLTDSYNHVLQELQQPSIEWLSFPVRIEAGTHLHIGIPPTVYSEACVVTVLLRGISHT